VRHDAQTGVQRVVRAVWNELQRRDGDAYQLVPVYASHDHGYCYAPLNFFDRPKFSRDPQPVTASGSDKFLGLDLSAHFLPKYRKQVRAWRANGATIHLVVYDLLPILRPEWFNKTTAVHFRKWFAILASDADQAICISKQVSRDLRDRLQSLGKKSQPSIVHMAMGGDIAASRPSSGISKEVSQLVDRLRFRPGILMVGTIEPRKGYDVALAAFEHLWRVRSSEAPDLVIVGKGGWKTLAIQNKIRCHKEHNNRLHWLDSVSDEGLCKLYDSCRGVFMASRGEGFGLPLIEAASHRRHVLARDLAVFREQELSNALYFDDDDPAMLGERLMVLAALGAQGRPAFPGLPTWSDSVDRLLRDIGLSKSDVEPSAKPIRTAS
jgi:glycosyltransferase involved in cell wall biosynthesis